MAGAGSQAARWLSLALVVLLGGLAACGAASDPAGRPTRASPPPTSPPPVPAREPPAIEDGKPQRLPSIDLFVGSRRVRAEVARTDPERQKGLMYRRDLGPDEGMLFVFPREEFRSFWMRNTPTPLSIAYIASDGRITQIADMRPFDETLVHSREVVRFALEMPRGWFRANGVAEGDRVAGLERAPAAEE